MNKKPEVPTLTPATVANESLAKAKEQIEWLKQFVKDNGREPTQAEVVARALR